MTEAAEASDVEGGSEIRLLDEQQVDAAGFRKGNDRGLFRRVAETANIPSGETDSVSHQSHYGGVETRGVRECVEGRGGGKGRQRMGE